MTLPQCYIGVDVSKNWIDVFVASAQKLIRIANRQSSLAEWVAGLGEVTVIFEATGRYDHELRIRLDELGIPYVRMNPLRARQFARAAGFLAKTDRLDARILCMMGEALRPEPTMPIQPVRQRLYDLQARREDIVVMIIAEQGRLSIAKDPFICRDLKASIRSLTRRRDALQEQIDAHIEANRQLAEQYRQLQSAPGVGPQVACRLMASMPELGRVDRRQIASLAGLAPHARESGLYKGKRTIHGGRSHVRRAMYMAALVAIRWDQHWKMAYHTMREAGKAAKTAIIAVARRLLVRINAMVKTGLSYQV
jgi:transposase